MPEARASKRSNPRRRPVTVTISPDVLEMVDTEAAALGMSRSSFVEVALKSYVTQLRERKENPMQTSIDFMAEYGSK